MRRVGTLESSTPFNCANDRDGMKQAESISVARRTDPANYVAIEGERTGCKEIQRNGCRSDMTWGS